MGPYCPRGPLILIASLLFVIASLLFVIASLLLSLRAQRSNLPFEYYGTPCYTRIHHAFLLHPVDCAGQDGRVPRRTRTSEAGLRRGVYPEPAEGLLAMTVVNPRPPTRDPNSPAHNSTRPRRCFRPSASAYNHLQSRRSGAARRQWCIRCGRTPTRDRLARRPA